MCNTYFLCGMHFDLHVSMVIGRHGEGCSLWSICQDQHSGTPCKADLPIVVCEYDDAHGVHGDPLTDRAMYMAAWSSDCPNILLTWRNSLQLCHSLQISPAKARSRQEE